MNGFIDIHHHILWGMDDGAHSFREAAGMMHAASKDGTEIIIASPHVTPGIADFNIPEYMHKIRRLNRYSYENQLNLLIMPGAEILYTRKTTQFLIERRIPSLANSKYVLVEFDEDDSYERIYGAMRSLSNGGFIPVIAHTERYKCLLRNIDLIEELKELFDAHIQVNASSVIHSRGKHMRNFVANVLNEGLVDFIATDSHNTRSRPTCMQECYEVIADSFSSHYADKVTRRNQVPIIADMRAGLRKKLSQRTG